MNNKIILTICIVLILISVIVMAEKVCDGNVCIEFKEVSQLEAILYNINKLFSVTPNPVSIYGTATESAGFTLSGCSAFDSSTSWICKWTKPDGSTFSISLGSRCKDCSVVISCSWSSITPSGSWSVLLYGWCSSTGSSSLPKWGDSSSFSVTQCIPDTCGSRCGTISDGCGGTITCSCSSGLTCSSGQCVCTQTCPSLGYQCGLQSICGWQVNCGTCPIERICASGQCVLSGCIPNCAGKQCGSDGCTGICGSCQSGYTCDVGSGTCQQCFTCSALNKQCGSWSDNCGGTLNCGSCQSGYNCNNGVCQQGICTSNWQCDSWGTCSNNVQVRTCRDTNNCNPSNPVNPNSLTQSCGTIICTENWSCTDWSACSNNVQTKTCTDASNCGTASNKPTTSRGCIASQQQAQQQNTITNSSGTFYICSDKTIVADYNSCGSSSGGIVGFINSIISAIQNFINWFISLFK